MLCFPSHHQHMTWGWLGGNEMVFLIICREKRESRELGMNIQFRPLQDVLLGLIIRRCIKWKLLFLCYFIHIDWFVSLYYKMCLSNFTAKITIYFVVHNILILWLIFVNTQRVLRKSSKLLCSLTAKYNISSFWNKADLTLCWFSLPINHLSKIMLSSIDLFSTQSKSKNQSDVADTTPLTHPWGIIPDSSPCVLFLHPLPPQEVKKRHELRHQHNKINSDILALEPSI